MEHKGQQLPSTGSRFAKPVKKLFTSNSEWLFVGLDYSSLEDRISALTTKDPNKLDVYLQGYDGHSLRAYNYFKSLMSDIELASDDDVCYSAKVGLSDIYWKSSDIINYQGKQYSGDEFYEMVAS